MIKIDNLELYTVAEIADTLHVKPQTVYQYISGGKIASRHIGKRVYVTKDALMRFCDGD